ncbi:MAG TPA: BLUF domain-containing protein [Allosphingosinicella sp.]|jgi:hypothetical protein|uniref:BLUF domain-containing protein n=1 Tax=Allosphingosinicella sp. TaxID=2823234 RepID=UPI002F288EB8
MLSLLYLSRCVLEPDDQERELRAILSVAVQRNLRSGITGALVHSGCDFAQILEGPEAAVAQVMGSILIDHRHEDVRILARQQIEQRSFPNWGMAQIAAGPELQRRIDAIRAARDDDELAVGISSLSDWTRSGASARV